MGIPDSGPGNTQAPSGVGRTGHGRSEDDAEAIHDIKNAVSSLSVLARNAATNLDDPEFRRDLIRALSSTVCRMQLRNNRLFKPFHSTKPH